MNNQFIFIGRICRNLVLKEAGSSKVLDVTLAIPRKFKNADGEYDTDFIKCKAFGKIAENIAEYNKVGDLICVSGRVQTSSYTNQEDKKVYTTDFIIMDVQFLAMGKKEETKKVVATAEVLDENGKTLIPTYKVPIANNDDPYASFGEEHSIELEELPFN